MNIIERIRKYVDTYKSPVSGYPQPITLTYDEAHALIERTNAADVVVYEANYCRSTGQITTYLGTAIDRWDAIAFPKPRPKHRPSKPMRNDWSNRWEIACECPVVAFGGTEAAAIDAYAKHYAEATK